MMGNVINSTIPTETVVTGVTPPPEYQAATSTGEGASLENLIKRFKKGPMSSLNGRRYKTLLPDGKVQKKCFLSNEFRESVKK